ncbi:MAG: CHAD domain-containing protein [Planctomycetes bacterium]|nr:CHAD domain-containing protein [Planctomycetota bacterium]
MGPVSVQSSGDPSAASRPLPALTLEGQGALRLRWRALLDGWTLRGERVPTTRELWLDSFDRRLQRAGVRLVASGTEPPVRCRLSGLAAGTAEPREFELERPPAFAWDFPAPLAAPLFEILEARRLDELALCEVQRARWAVLDENQKIVAWIEEERSRLVPPRARARSAPSVQRLHLCALRGYELEFERLARALRALAGLHVVEGEGGVLEALLPAPTRPRGWPALAPDVAALEGLTRVARTQLAVLRANEGGLRKNRDAEFLHDMRVALRRLRSLLSQLEGVLEPKLCAELGTELRWLAGCTGPARDLDTLMLELRLTEPALRSDLAPVLEALEAERARQQVELLVQLDSARRRALLERLRSVFGRGREPSVAGARAARPFARVLAKRLRRRLRQVLTRAAHIEAASPASELHALRIACKKLRYLLECCRGLVAKELLSACFARLKRLQEVLGAIQDVEVQTRLVFELALPCARDAGARAHLALGRFLERSAARSRAARTHYHELAADLDSATSRAQFAALFAALEGAGLDAR